MRQASKWRKKWKKAIEIDEIKRKQKQNTLAPVNLHFNNKPTKKQASQNTSKELI